MKRILITIIALSLVIIVDSSAQPIDWEVVQSNTSVNLNSIFFYDHQFGFVCGDSGVILKSIDSGKTWQSLQSPLTINLNDCFMFEQNCMIAVGDSGMCLLTWDGKDSLIIGDLSEYEVDLYSVSFSRNSNNSSGVFGARSQSLFVGHSDYCFTVIHDIYIGSAGGFWGTYMLTAAIGFVAGENSISQPIVGRKNVYGSSTWDFVSFYLDGNEGRATGVAFTDSLIGYISAMVWDGRGAIAKTTDNGDTWTTTFFSKPLHDINFPISGTSQIGYCVGDSGTILKTFNAGENWYNQISGTSENLNQVYFVDSDFGFAVGENGTILRTTNGGGPTTRTEDEDFQLYNFELQQNYPNPFNLTTNIGFRIAYLPDGKVGFGFVSLKVYDVLGNEVATLVNEEKSAGEYKIEFNAYNLPSGVYFYRLQAGSFNQIKKMILIK
jgi:photosystem II stability/assembly factor-like uncharacterized protein